MAVKLNKRAFVHAQKLIAEGKLVIDDKDDWSEHQPTTEIENMYLEEHDYGEFSKWYLGVDDEENDRTKKRYKFPFGDFKKVHRCGVLAVENRAGQYKYYDIEQAAAHLHGMIDSSKPLSLGKS